MNIIKPSFEICTLVDGIEACKHLEKCGRVCYRSEGKITEDSYVSFLRRIIKSGHESVLEHFSFTVFITVDRGITHEIVRHRLASYSQESTRYCNYTKEGFDSQITYIDISDDFLPNGGEAQLILKRALKNAELAYFDLVDIGVRPEIARNILPHSLKTTIAMTCNIREWRHFFKERTSGAAHPQIREIAIPLLKECKQIFPILFDDIEVADE